MELSVQLDDNILDKVKNELENLYAIIDGYSALQAIRESKSEKSLSNPFWREVTVALTDQVTINWCKLFGIDCQDTYWKQTTLEQASFREAVYAKTGMDYKGWDKYRHEMHELRNELIHHMTPYHELSCKLDLLPAFQIASACHIWLRQVFNFYGIQAEGPINLEDYVDISTTNALQQIEE